MKGTEHCKWISTCTKFPTHHISYQGTSPCSRAHNNPVCKVRCSLLPPNHVHTHSVQSLGHTSCCSGTRTRCRNLFRSALADSASHTVPHPTQAYTDMPRSRGHSRCYCHHDSCTRGCTPVQTIQTHTSAHTTHPCSPGHRCMSLEAEHSC